MAFGKRYTPEQVQRMCELYREGSSIRMIAAKYNASYGGVHHMLITNGVTIRQRKEAAKLMVERYYRAKGKAS